MLAVTTLGFCGGLEDEPCGLTHVDLLRGHGLCFCPFCLIICVDVGFLAQRECPYRIRVRCVLVAPAAWGAGRLWHKVQRMNAKPRPDMPGWGGRLTAVSDPTGQLGDKECHASGLHRGLAA